jgi:hypothetical protein
MFCDECIFLWGWHLKCCPALRAFPLLSSRIIFDAELLAASRTFELDHVVPPNYAPGQAVRLQFSIC